MKTYFFNSTSNEYKISAKNLTDALTQLVEQLVTRNEMFNILPYYYCNGPKKLSRSIYDKYLTGYSF